MRKLSIFFASILFFLSTSLVSAFPKESFVTFSFPVRGWDNWNITDQTPLDVPLFAYEEASASSMPITWMLRFDAIEDEEISSRFADLVATDSSQLLGGLLEVTPELSRQANTTYSDSGSFYSANHIYLSGYSPEDRIRLIDTYMETFFLRFGFYPTTVGADHLDAISLQYLQEHYSVVGVLVEGEKYQSSNLVRWGGPLFSSYLPSSKNSLIPAQSGKEKVDLTVSYWSLPDPRTFYTNEKIKEPGVNIGANFGFSTEYLDSLLAIYTQKDLNESTHLNIRLDNDYQIVFKGELSANKQIRARQNITDLFETFRDRQNKYTFRFFSLQRYSDLFKARHPETSVASFYNFTDKEDNVYYWYQNPYYRLGVKKDSQGTHLIDFRLYNPNEAEEYYSVANIDTIIYSEAFALIDSLKYPDQVLDLDIDLSLAETKAEYWDLIITQGDKKIHLQPQKIVFTGLDAPSLKSKDIKVKNKGEQTTWILKPQTPFSTTLTSNLISFFKLILFIAFAFFLLGCKKKDNPPYSKLLAVIVLFTSLLVVLRSGLLDTFGLGFWGPNGHDAIFHLSVISSLKDSLFNLSHPQISGFFLQNYHLAFDFLTALFSRLLNIPVLDLFFRVFPLVIGLGIIYFFTRLLHLWKYSKRTINLSLIFSFLTGSLGFIFYLFKGQPFAGESLFWSNQSISLFLNPPFALSLCLLLAFLYLFEKYQSHPNKKLFLLMILVGGLLAQAKVYAFLLLCLALLLAFQIKLLLGVGLIGLLLTLPTLGASSFPFVFAPLWFTRSMFAAQDRLNWQRLVEAWQVYEAQGRIVRLFLVNLFALSVFLLGNLGVRFLGLKKMFQPSKFSSQKLIKIIILSGIIIPIIFIQSVNPWNTIQFLYYSLFFLGIFTAKHVSDKMAKRGKFRSTTYLIWILLFTLPTTIGTLRDYITPLPASKIGFTELHALKILSQQERGVVVSPLYSLSQARRLPSPKPLHAYTSTAYISAFSGQPEFLSDTINLDITGFDYSDRAKDIQRLYATLDTSWVENFLLDNNIGYLYETPNMHLNINPQTTCLESIFDSGGVNVYKVTCHE